ncbi:MAG TPA: glycolate oxidase subunit GlcE [Salinisphaeraceae bacterium]|nr:glycolate oxidase subunit GlcE [Salinisphaeraceae bacterium]
MSDRGEQLQADVAAALAAEQPLRIAGSGSKAFLGEAGTGGKPLAMTVHSGIVNYQPSELIVTVRAGTRLAELQDTLAREGQMLGFEPPHFGASATIGGTIAAGLSGPARPYAGAARDFVLGCRLINGRAQVLRFGGEVMKNVAGYDLSRLMVGAWGTLGVLLDVSLKVLPLPRAQTTLVRPCSAAEAITLFNRWAGKPHPISATWWEDGHAYVRLAGAQPAIAAARAALGGDPLEDDADFWAGVREQRRAFFAGDAPLWRLALAPATPPLALAGARAIDWGGAQRWLRSEADAHAIRAAVAAVGGHASVYRGQATPRFHPLPAGLLTLHRRLKQSLDPAGLFNRGRLYPDL